MPTGYTAGILDGSIKKFSDFAKKCTRAFGATLHMRDESLEKKYEPRKVSTYYLDTIKDLNKKLAKIQKISDKDLIKETIKKLEKDKEYWVKSLDEKNKLKEKLDSFLQEAKKWTPPTNDHQDYKKFMIDQLNETIKWDTDDSYVKEKLAEIQNKIENLDASEIRKEIIEDIHADISYNFNKHKEEEQKVFESNKWVEDVFNTFK